MIEPLGISGIAYYTASLCENLAKKHELKLITSKYYELKEEGIEEIDFVKPILGGMERNLPKPLRLLNYTKSLFIIVETARKFKPDIVHWQDSFIPLIDQLSIFYLSYLLHIPIIYTAHDVKKGALLGNSQIGEDGALQRIYARANHIIVHSNNAKNQLISEFYRDSKSITVLPLGIQEVHENSRTFSKQEAREDLKIDSEKFVFLFFGNLKISKGLDILLEAFAKVLRIEPHVYLLVAGPSRAENNIDYFQMADELGIDASSIKFEIAFIPLERVPIYFAASDLVVLPYIKVYQSAVIQTSYALERPVLITPLDELVEVIEENKTGFVSKSLNVDDLADAMINSIKYRSELEAMGKYARQMAKQNFSWERIADLTTQIYKKVLL